jgi:ParB family transcriptional regulator, chromosome partitioning protein
MDTSASDAKKRSLSGTEITKIPVKNLRANPYNRTHLEEKGLDELARVIAKEGVSEPLLVRPTEEWEVYEIASGHRRWRAAQRANVEEVPCLVKNLSHQQVSEMNIVASIQRGDTAALEVAGMVSDYMLRFSRTQAQAAKSFGKSLSWIAELISFSSLPAEILENVTALKISYKGMQALKRLHPLEQQIELAKKLADGSLAPDDLEATVRELLKAVRKGGDRRHASRRATDPLAARWAGLMEDDQVAPRGSWKIRFAGNNKWELHYPVDEKNPSSSLAAFLRKLADALDKA